jgi:hypothetical protein
MNGRHVGKRLYLDVEPAFCADYFPPAEKELDSDLVANHIQFTSVTLQVPANDYDKGADSQNDPLTATNSSSSDSSSYLSTNDSLPTMSSKAGTTTKILHLPSTGKRKQMASDGLPRAPLDSGPPSSTSAG